MMWIEMVMHMSGTRANGEKYPPGFTPFLVEDWEGEHLIRGGCARQIAPPPGRAQAPVAVPAPPAPEPPVPQSEPSPTAAGPVMPDVPRSEPSLTAAGPEPQAAEPEPEPEPDARRPAPSDPKQAWVDYAVAQGLDWDTASRMTKADLQSRYGGRL